MARKKTEQPRDSSSSVPTSGEVEELTAEVTEPNEVVAEAPADDEELLPDVDPTVIEDVEEATDEPMSRTRRVTSSVSKEDLARLLKALQTTLPESVRGNVVDGLMNVVLGDEGLVRNLTDRNIPKEAAGFLFAGAETTRREVMRIVSKEVRNFLASVDLGGELTKILTSVSFEVTFKAGFVPNQRVVDATDGGEKKDARPTRGILQGVGRANESAVEVLDSGEPEEVLEPTDGGKRQGVRNYTERFWSVVNDRLIQPSLAATDETDE